MLNCIRLSFPVLHFPVLQIQRPQSTINLTPLGLPAYARWRNHCNYRLSTLVYGIWSSSLLLLFSLEQTAVKLSGAEAADRAQCAAAD